MIRPQEAAAMNTMRSPPILAHRNNRFRPRNPKTIPQFWALGPHWSLACPPRICVKQYPQKKPPRTSPESILLQWNFSDMGTTQMGMVILAPYSRQVPRNSIRVHFRRRGLPR